MKQLSLKQWIDAMGREEAARLLKVDRSAVGHWYRHIALPTADKMQKIVRYSRGAVSYERMIEDHVRFKK